MKALMLALLLGWSAAAAAAGPALAKLPPAQLQARQQSDLDTVLRYRDGLRQRLFDYYLAFDSIARQHADFRSVSGTDFQARSFQVNQAVFLAQYRTALEFIEATRHEPGLDVLSIWPRRSHRDS